MKKLTTLLLFLSAAVAFASPNGLQRQAFKTAAEVNSISDLLHDTEIYVTATGLNKQLSQAIIDGDLSGGGAMASVDFYSLFDFLYRVENGIATPRIPNQIYDTFATSKGTYSNVTNGGDKLFVTPGMTSGYQERDKLTTAVAASIQGVATIANQALAPKAVTIAADTITFAGDVTEFFPVNKNVVIFEQLVSDGDLQHLYLNAGTGGNVATLEVLSVVYNSGPDETEIVVDNPDVLDLDFALSAAQYPATLRVAPFDYKMEAKANTADSYQALDLKEAHTTGLARIAGENTLSTAGSQTGSVLFHYANHSADSVYWVAVTGEKTGGNTDIRISYSVDSGKSFTTFVTAISAGVSQPENISGSFKYFHNNMIAVANNGKAFIAFPFYNGSGEYAVHARYTDLTAGTPALSLTADNTPNAFGSNLGSGIVGDSTQSLKASAVAMDSDGDTVVVFISNQAGTQGTTVGYTSGGATLGLFAFNNFLPEPTYPDAAFVTGTTGAHKYHLLYTKSSTDIIRYNRFTEGSWTPAETVDLPSAGSTGAIVGAILDETSDRVHVMGQDTTNARIFSYYIDNVLSGTPAASARMDLSYNADSTVGADGYIGWSASSAENYAKTSGETIIVNPNDGDNVVYATSLIGADTIVRRPLIYEIRDVTSYLGTQISQHTNDTTVALRDTTSRQTIHQTLTLAGETLGTWKARLYQVGDIPFGSQLTAKLYNTTGGNPTTLVAAAINSIDPSLLTKATVGQNVYFRFNKVTPGAGTYAIVYEADYPISASNFARIEANSAGGYAGGTLKSFDGATYTDLAIDSAFEFNGEFIYESSEGVSGDQGTRPYYVYTQAMETQIGLNPDDTASITTRSIPSNDSSVYFPKSGQPFKKILSFGTGATASTITAWKQFGYSAANYDGNLLFSVALGADLSARRSTSTGVLDANARFEDRSGLTAYSATNSMPSPTVDTDFVYDTCYDLNGTSNAVAYDAALTGAYHVKAIAPFIVDAEIKGGSVSGVRPIVATSAEWQFETDAGYLQMSMMSGASVVKANDATEVTTYHWVRYYWDGTIARLYRSNDGQSFTEVASYSQQDNAVDTSGGSILRIGTNTGTFWSGKLGIIKVGREMFTYDWFRDQSALVDTTNFGNRMLAEAKSGKNSSTLEDHFDTLMMISSDANAETVVDSYEDQFIYTKTFTNPGSQLWLKTTLGIGSDRNSSFIDGYNYRFVK